MKNRRTERGSVMLIVVLVAALLTALVMGRLQVNTGEIQLMQNHIGGAEALATAEAGWNDALVQLSQDSGWNSGFVDKPFNGGSYTVVVDGSTIRCTGVTSRGFVARVEAQIAAASEGPPYLIRINEWRINP